MKEDITYNASDDQLIIKTTYDNSDVLKANQIQRNEAPEFGRYKQKNTQMVHVGRIAEGDIVRLKQLGYNLLSPDKEEWKRALLYIQQNEPHLLTVPGKPFAKKRAIWY